MIEGVGMKICKDCGIKKPLDEFHRNVGRADGHVNSCKICRRNYWANRPKGINQANAKRWRDENPEKAKFSTKRWRKKNPKKIMLQSKQWRKENPEKMREIRRRHCKKYPERTKARNAVSNAIRDGYLQRMPCEVCGEPKSQGHHQDYNKPLDVIWLCAEHHREADRMKNEVTNDKTGT